MRNGQSSVKSVSHILPNQSASASAKESSGNVKVSKRITDRGASPTTQKSESSVGVATSSVVKKTDGTVSSNNADNVSKKSSLNNNNHDNDDNSSLRRSGRISASSDSKDSKKSFIDSNIAPVPVPVPVPPRKRKERDNLNDSKLSSASAPLNSKAVRKGRALSIEVISGISQRNHAILSLIYS